ncbi:MAG TPA: exo-alpha-sialidase, partial [Bacteroidota bacterium]
PARFGFPLAIHPHNPNTVYVVPEEGAEYRGPVGGFGVYRSKNKGAKWQKLNKGLPAKEMFVHVYRQAMSVDTCDPCGVYVGTSGGHILYSRNEGDSWRVLANWMPSVFSLSAAVV